ncbi:MAG: tyrosine-type recombinase/integrase [Nitrospirota bacterium]
MGLFKRGKVWWIRIKYKGKLIRRSTGTTSKELAIRIESKVLNEVIEGRWFSNEAKRKTFEELRDRYMKEYSTVHKTPKSSLRDETSFKHLTQFFSGLTLAEITPSKISEYKSLRKAEGAKPATLARELECFRHALNLAIREWEWLDRNPFERVRIEKCNNKIERWMTSEEEQRLLNASLPWLKEIITVALNTGMRQDEILSVKWSQVDFFRRTVTLLETKNKEKRTIPLNQIVLELLKVKSKVTSISGYVFTSHNGTKIDARNLLRAFYSARKKAGLQDVRFHDLRHTFATRLVQAGINIYVVKELLGHKTLTMTMRYAHHYPESLRHGVEILDKGAQKVTQSNKKGSEESPKPLNSLVAGSGFEPLTFGL